MINQVRFAPAVKHFSPGFCKRWNVKEYNSMKESCLFAGVYVQEDVDVINAHYGFKVVWSPGRIRDCFFSILPDVIVREAEMMDCSSLQGKYRIKKAQFEIQDYSVFQPNVLGDKVYWYLGNDSQKDSYRYDLVSEVQSRIQYEILLGFQGYSLLYVKQQYYDNCFVNIKPNPIGGFTTSTELACMGRYTIGNGDAVFYLPFRDVNDIVFGIELESRKIGTVQSSLIGSFFNVGEEWKDENFWLS